MYNFSEGVPQDYKEAVKWYTLAANQGNANAQINLGNRYYYSQGVFTDFIIAHMWLNIAAANGYEPAAKKRKTVAENMTSEDISKAQAMARVCMNSNDEKCGY